MQLFFSPITQKHLRNTNSINENSQIRTNALKTKLAVTTLIAD
jgi:hypothetical protein